MLSLVFLLLVFMTVQAALYYHARNVVKAEVEYREHEWLSIDERRGEEKIRV